MAQFRELEPGDAPELQSCYHTYEWWDDREEADVRTAIEATDLPIGAFEDGTLVGAARVLTDFVYYATVYDVIVHADNRDGGVGRELMADVLDHPDLSDLDSITLTCREGLVDFYRDCGFEPVEGQVEHGGGTEELVRMRSSPGRPQG